MKTARIRQKKCDHCTVNSLILYRVQLGLKQPWIYLCANCRTKAQLELVGYRYGGTWKANKRH